MPRNVAVALLGRGHTELFIKSVADDYRLSGLIEMLHHASAEDTTSGRIGYDISAPQRNKHLQMPFRDAMQARERSSVEADASFTWEPNLIHPTQADHDAAIAHAQHSTGVIGISDGA